MNERESNSAVTICLIVSLLAHFGAFTGWTFWQWWSKVEFADRVDPGDNVPDRMTVAWISHNDFRELVAPQRPTIQPAVQTKVDPVKNAPVDVDPEPPNAPSSPGGGSPSEQADETNEQQPPAEAEPTKPDPALEKPNEVAGVIEPNVNRDKAESNPAKIPNAPSPAVNDTTPNQTSNTANTKPVPPTSAPKADKEAPPTTRDELPDAVKPGKVVVGNGIEIKTTLIRPLGVATYWVAPRRNPKALILFNRDGSVYKVSLITKSGSTEWDLAILTSLYRWRASGERLKKSRGRYATDFRILIAPSLEPIGEKKEKTK